MNRYLETGTEITLRGIEGTFVINALVGRGSSCAVYQAEFTNALGKTSEHLLKEFNPKSLEVIRKEDGSLCAKNEDTDAFEQSKKHFIAGFEKQELFRRKNGLKNYTANVQNYYEDHGTVYIDMNVTEGVSYTNVRERTIYDLARRMKVLAQVVGKYHEYGYLHLDLKPDNIYVRPENETCEDVLLFDFDSVIEKYKLQTNSMVSYTKEWAALELTSASRRHLICEATDIFSIGEIFFEKLMGRHSEPWERRSFSQYTYNVNLPIWENVNPKVQDLVDEVFRHTLCNDVATRYQTMEELISQLDKIIKVSNPEKTFLKSSCPEPLEFFVGRDQELHDIHKYFQNSNVLFLSGMGGIGKSELAKNYAKQYATDYDTRIFVPYLSDLSMAIADNNAIPIYNFYRYPEEKMEEYAKRKFRKLKELCDVRTLIIVDNFDCTEDSLLPEFLKLDANIIVTTRMDFSEYNRGQIKIDKLQNNEHIFDIFRQYYTKPMTAEELACVEQILDLICGHTMTVELLAKQMMAGRVIPQIMLEKLEADGISDSGNEKLRISKDDKFESGNVNEHIRALFDLSELDEGEKLLLANLSLIPYTGILTELFFEWCELKDYGIINQLILEGWIRIDKERDYISLHPVVADVVSKILLRVYGERLLILNNSIEYIERKNISGMSMAIRLEISYLFYQIALAIIRVKMTGKVSIEYLAKSSEIYWKFGYLAEAIKLCERALSLNGSVIDENEECLIDLYNVIGHLYKEAGRYERAEKYNEEALKRGITIWGEIHDKVAVSYDNLGNIFDKQCNFDRAEKYYLNALRIREILYGTEYNDVAVSYNNLGILYRHQGYFEKAESYYIKAREIWIKLYGYKDANVARLYNNLGSMYREMDRFDEAENLLVESLSIRKYCFGEVHMDTATSLNNLGVFYNEQGKLEEAEKYFSRAKDVWLKLFGEMDWRVATVYGNIGSVYSTQKKYELAEKALYKALQIRKILYGEESNELAVSYCQLGFLYDKQKEWEKSEDFYLRAYSIWSKLYGEMHEVVAASCNNLGVLYKEWQKYDLAENHLKKAMVIRQYLYGELHNKTAETRYNLGSLYLKMGQVDLAESQLLTVYDSCLKLTGETSIPVARCQVSLGNLYYTLNKKEEARYYFDKAYTIRRMILGENHKDTLRIKNKLELFE